MNKEFIPYEQALELKELGFDKPCFGCYFHNNKDAVEYNPDGIPLNHNNRKSRISAPLYQQAFRWFREKYDFHFSIDRERSQRDFEWGYNWSLYNFTGICSEYLTSHPNAPAGEWVYETYEEAELACLKKLIEIIKSNKKI